MHCLYVKPRIFKGNLLLWFIAKNRHTWPQKRRFCGFCSHFLLDSLFHVAARRDCLSGEGNRARAGAAMTWGSCIAFLLLPQCRTDTVLTGDRNKVQALVVAWQSHTWGCCKETRYLLREALKATAYVSLFPLRLCLSLDQTAETQSPSQKNFWCGGCLKINEQTSQEVILSLDKWLLAFQADRFLWFELCHAALQNE